MNDILYDTVEELINQYNSKFIEYGIEVKIQRRLYKETVEAYNHYVQHSLIDLLLYILIYKRIEEKNFHHTPNRYKLLVLQVNPIKKTPHGKKDYKKYAFLTYELSRAYQGEKPIEKNCKEQSVVAKVEKRLRKMLKKAEKATSPNWCNNTLWDTLRYSFSKKYGYIENYCGKSRFFWEVLWDCIFAAPFLLFAIGGLIHSIIH